MSNTKSEFSEFTYGFALTHELLSGPAGSFLKAPTFPSLRDEGTKGGFDVKIHKKGKPLFVQFKLSEPLLTRRAKECRDLSFRSPCYRMHFWPRSKSKQHSLLLDLEKQNNGGVFYYAPAFWTVTDLDRHFAGKRIEAHSRRARPSALPIPVDGQSHHLSFDSAGGPNLALYSEEPHRIELDERPMTEVLKGEFSALSADGALDQNLFRLEKWFVRNHLVDEEELLDDRAMATQAEGSWRSRLYRLATWSAIYLNSSFFVLQAEEG